MVSTYSLVVPPSLDGGDAAGSLDVGPDDEDDVAPDDEGAPCACLYSGPGIDVR